VDLILWRHAEAIDGDDDLARELSARGRKQAERMARWLAKRVPVPTRVVSSPAARARQTAAAFVENFEIDERIAPLGSPDDVLAACGWPAADSAVIAIGHQPTFGRVVAAALTGRAADWSIRKGAIVWLRSRQRDGAREVVLYAALAPELL
jgi:phosphohistidine phosphatase